MVESFISLFLILAVLIYFLYITHYVKCIFASVILNLTIMNEQQIKFIREISDDMRDFGFLEHIADWIGCQFALESNFGNSRIAKMRNNLCGMKVPLLRPSTNVGYDGFARYPSKYFCEIDYVLWLAYNRFSGHDLTNLDHFTMHLKAKKYCPDSDYIERINNLYQQFKNSTK